LSVPLSGHTTVSGIIGAPVAHSRSPAIFNAAYDALGLDWTYVAFPVAPGAVRDALVGLRALGVAGCNVTMPHKAEAAQACDELAPAAAELGVVNVVVVRDGRLLGDTTDGPGFVDAALEAGVTLRDRTALVVGAGGAARAIAASLCREGTHVVVAARRVDAARAAAAGGEAVALDAVDDRLADADLVETATPLGMEGEPPPFNADKLEARHTVIDAIYTPAETPLLAAAARRGATALNGLGMLVHQAARSFTLLTGKAAPVDVMWAAARRAS
jgi:shikimate dehydrogenase